MPNLVVPATAEGMPLRPLEDLLSDYLVERRASNALHDRWTAARGMLPDWAAPGPQYLHHDGRFSGAIVGWPMVECPTPPEHTAVFRSVRSSPREAFNHCMVMAPRADDDRPQAKHWRRACRLNGFKAARKRIKRIREQRLEEARVGLPAIEAAADANSDRIIVLEDQMRLHTVGAAPEALALLLVLEMIDNINLGEPIEDQPVPHVCAEMLSRLAPLLNGTLSVVVQDIVDHRQRRYRELLIGGSRAYQATDGHPIDAVARDFVEAA